MNYFNFIKKKVDVKRRSLSKILFALMIYGLLQGIMESPLIVGIYRVEVIASLLVIVSSIVVAFLQLKYGTISIVSEYVELKQFDNLQLVKILISQLLLMLLLGFIYIVGLVIVVLSLVVSPMLIGLVIIMAIVLSLGFVYLATITEFALINHLIDPSISIFKHYSKNVGSYCRYMVGNVIKYIILTSIVQSITVIVIRLFHSGANIQIFSLFVAIIVSLIANIIVFWLAMTFDQVATLKLLEVTKTGNIENSCELDIDLHN